MKRPEAGILDTVSSWITRFRQVNAGKFSCVVPVRAGVPRGAALTHGIANRSMRAALISSVTASAPVAIILAAGLGMRLQSVHADRPKGFVEIGGEPLIARSVRALRAAGLREFIFVTGWKADVYRQWCREHCPEARVLENSDYATTGSLRSLLIGAVACAGRAAVVVESDLLYEKRAAAAVMAAAEPNVVLGSGRTGSRDEVWIYADHAGRISNVGKTLRPDEIPAGELVGISRFSPALLNALARAAHELPPLAHYEDGLTAVASAHTIALHRIDDLAWCEIDDASHLERARNEIWPRVQAADARHADQT